MESAGLKLSRDDEGDSAGSSELSRAPRRATSSKFLPSLPTQVGNTKFGDFSGMIESLPESIAIFDIDGTILATNKVWRRTVGRFEMDNLLEGGNYRDYCVQHAGGNPDALAVIAGLDDVAAARAESFRHHYAGTDLTHGHDYEVCISRVELDGLPLLICANYDVTAERHLKQQCRSLERTLLRIQTLERQRIGRDLHDSTAQQLVALRLSLIRLKQMQPDEPAMAVLADIEDSLDQMNHEIRAISYLLHPPSLENANLVDAIDAMVRGFARRTNLDITFQFEGRRAHWDRLLEAALYRLAQEALANVQRHAHASQARIRLIARPTGYLHLIIEDNGIGILASMAQTSSAIGVGLSGMQARIDELGGRFSSERCAHGTRIVASLRAEYDETIVDRRKSAGRRRPPPARRPHRAGDDRDLGQPKRRKHHDL